jgi:hypothetical protein
MVQHPRMLLLTSLHGSTSLSRRSKLLTGFVADGGTVLMSTHDVERASIPPRAP